MIIEHIKSLDLWLMSRGGRVLYRGKVNPWRSPELLEAALRRGQLKLVDARVPG